MTTVEYRVCEHEHLSYIVAQDVQMDEIGTLLSPQSAEAFAAFPMRLSAWAEGRCIGAAGLIHAWKGRYIAWAMLSKHIGPYMLQVSRKVRSVLDDFPANRIEMVVIRDFEPGNRWAKLLGFHLETPDGMPGYYLDGGSANLYARIR